MTNFVSVATSAARYQDISLNPQKLAGQCAKLKCCLNFEVDTYVESSKFLPERNVRLETADATYYHFKTDIFKKEITYSTDKQMAANLVTIDAGRAFEVIEMNKRGEKPLKLEREDSDKSKEKARPIDLASQDDLTRFDKSKKKKKKKKPQAQGAQQQQQQQPEEGRDVQTQQTQQPRQPRGQQPKEGSSGRQPRQDGAERRPRNDRQGQKPQPKGERQQPQQVKQKPQDASARSEQRQPGSNRAPKVFRSPEQQGE